MIDVPTLKTDRFTLRPLRREDAAALFPTLGDETQCRYLTRPAFESEEELWGWLAEPDWNGRTWIAEDGEGEVAARFVSVPGHEDGVEEIGYITCAHRQGEGVARECTRALVAHLFTADGLRKLTAEVDADNTASIRLLERLGFAREAFFREHETTHIGLRDVMMYGLLASEWSARG
ncbi:GNAT family N-acetyltransferase [Qipengyuania aquimaris]|uniref:GNAT family N-acetyltransferase n=1 Tax=Qipengyuania aquimaris TaxID=255984 RepID=UPI001C9819B9|nr:GNAT family protein [Qipengyuania aquimaris]MBY6128471.1 GNAT family N-acetyltransferase [Qipengyuania aquimaris]